MQTINVAAALAASTLASLASAQVLTGPITNPANGHDYFLLEQDTWTNSEAEAVALGGHLATINDAAENQWVFDTFASFDGVDRNLWIGLNDVDVEGTFVWTSGEILGYTNWGQNQPDGNAPDADFVLIIDPSPTFTINPGEWNDATPSSTAWGVVEVVPEPTSVGFLAAGGFITLMRRRR